MMSDENSLLELIQNSPLFPTDAEREEWRVLIDKMSEEDLAKVEEVLRAAEKERSDYEQRLLVALGEKETKIKAVLQKVKRLALAADEGKEKILVDEEIKKLEMEIAQI